ncbi:hypothetical protein NL676_006804 [Syzygium grande]|nr:hypothetical protein NL676_006804 [Syzygium grande]
MYITRSWWKLFHEIPLLPLSNLLLSLFVSESELEGSIRCGTDDFLGSDSLLAFLIGMEVGGFNQFSGRRLDFESLIGSEAYFLGHHVRDHSVLKMRKLEKYLSSLISGYPDFDEHEMHVLDFGEDSLML